MNSRNKSKLNNNITEWADLAGWAGWVDRIGWAGLDCWAGWTDRAGLADWTGWAGLDVWAGLDCWVDGTAWLGSPGWLGRLDRLGRLGARQAGPNQSGFSKIKSLVEKCSTVHSARYTPVLLMGMKTIIQIPGWDTSDGTHCQFMLFTC